MAYNEYDPYGTPIQTGEEPYGYTGEWWEEEVALFTLRARWYLPETGTFLSVDPVETEPPYLYVRGNPVNLTDPSGKQAVCDSWSGAFRNFCFEAENGNLEAIEGFYRAIVLRNRYEGFSVSADFLEHYLNGSGEAVNLADFGYHVRDWVVYSTEYEQRIYNRLHAKILKDHVLPALRNCVISPIQDTVELPSVPPFGTDIRGAFGRHSLKGYFKTISISGDLQSFQVEIDTKFHIPDYYDFDPSLGIDLNQNFDTNLDDSLDQIDDWLTGQNWWDLNVTVGPGTIGFVPHKWLVQLRDAGMAAEFDMDAVWNERMFVESSAGDVAEFYTGDQLELPGEYQLLEYRQ